MTKIQNSELKIKKIHLSYLLLHYKVFAFYYFFPLGFILLNSCQVLFFCPQIQSPCKIYIISIIALIILYLPILSNLFFYIPFLAFNSSSFLGLGEWEGRVQASQLQREPFQ